MVAEPEVGGNSPVRIDLGRRASHHPTSCKPPILPPIGFFWPISWPPNRFCSDTHMVVVLPAPLWPRKDTTWFS